MVGSGDVGRLLTARIRKSEQASASWCIGVSWSAGWSPHVGNGAIPKNPWKREMEAKGSLGIAKAGIEVRDSIWSNLK
jgi:hypothetical protein